MPGRNFLFVPGPTNVPDRVLNAMHRAMEDHRSPVFPKLPLSIFPDLKKVFRTTEGQPFIFAATGPVPIHIRADKPITHIRVSPARLNLHPTPQGRDVSFTIPARGCTSRTDDIFCRPRASGSI